MLGVSIPGSFRDALVDGVLLCRVLDRVRGGSSSSSSSSRVAMHTPVPEVKNTGDKIKNAKAFIECVSCRYKHLPAVPAAAGCCAVRTVRPRRLCSSMTMHVHGATCVGCRSTGDVVHLECDERTCFSPTT